MAKRKKQPTTVISPDILPEPEVYRVLAPDGSMVGRLPEVSEAQLKRMYETMLLIRLLDERMMAGHASCCLSTCVVPTSSRTASMVRAYG